MLGAADEGTSSTTRTRRTTTSNGLCHPTIQNPTPFSRTHTRGLSEIRRHTESAYRRENRFKEMDCACVWLGWEYVWKCVSVFCVQVRKRHTLNKMLTKGFFELLHMAHTHTITQIYNVCVHVLRMYVYIGREVQGA